MTIIDSLLNSTAGSTFARGLLSDDQLQIPENASYDTGLECYLLSLEEMKDT